MVENKYPEHEKIKALAGANQTVGDFIEWCSRMGMDLCRFNPATDEYHPEYMSRDQLIAAFFGIDSTALEAEKRAMLETLRG